MIRNLGPSILDCLKNHFRCERQPHGHARCSRTMAARSPDFLHVSRCPLCMCSPFREAYGAGVSDLPIFLPSIFLEWRAIFPPTTARVATVGR